LAQKMLEERIEHYNLRRGHAPDVHAKYLLVANVIRSIRHPFGSLYRNFITEKLRLRRQRRRVFFAKAKRQNYPPVTERVYTPALEGI
jgi:hypothetical protein